MRSSMRDESELIRQADLFWQKQVKLHNEALLQHEQKAKQTADIENQGNAPSNNNSTLKEELFGSTGEEEYIALPLKEDPSKRSLQRDSSNSQNEKFVDSKSYEEMEENMDDSNLPNDGWADRLKGKARSETIATHKAEMSKDSPEMGIGRNRTLPAMVSDLDVEINNFVKEKKEREWSFEREMKRLKFELANEISQNEILLNELEKVKRLNVEKDAGLVLKKAREDLENEKEKCSNLLAGLQVERNKNRELKMNMDALMLKNSGAEENVRKIRDLENEIVELKSLVCAKDEEVKKLVTQLNINAGLKKEKVQNGMGFTEGFVVNEGATGLSQDTAFRVLDEANSPNQEEYESENTFEALSTRKRRRVQTPDGAGHLGGDDIENVEPETEVPYHDLKLTVKNEMVYVCTKCCAISTRKFAAERHAKMYTSKGECPRNYWPVGYKDIDGFKVYRRFCLEIQGRQKMSPTELHTNLNKKMTQYILKENQNQTV